MGTNLIRAMLLASASATFAVTAVPTAAYAQEASYQFDIPAQPMGDALRALGRVTKKSIFFDGAVVRGKRSVAVKGRMTASEALSRMVSGSGLVASQNSSGWVVQGGNGDAAPTRAEASASAAQVTVSAPSSAVVDARTGAALKGALVEIVETGERTSTGDLGEFRFPGKNGSFNLRISYLGYPEYQQFVDLKNGRATTGILLSDGGTNYDIIVTAPQSARAQALNQERAAANTSTVVSADLLGQFDGTTISDALRRSPGVAFEVDSRTGDGRNIMIRGLGSSFNTVTLNGLRVPVSDGSSRSPALNTILADSVAQININKTLLPSQDGSGTGGLVEIITKGPLDRPDRYFSVTAEKAYAGKSFLDESFVSGTASMKFGADKNFGVSVSAQYRKREINNITFDQSHRIGRYLPATDGGRPVFSEFDIDPRTVFPFEDGVTDVYATQFGVNENRTNVENLALTASAQWQIGDHSNLRLDFSHNRSTSDFANGAFIFVPYSGQVSMPIDELNGEVRAAELWENAAFPGRAAYVSRNINLVDDQKDRMTNISFTGNSEFGPWSLDYKAGYAKGTLDTPTSFSSAFAVYGVMFDDADVTPEILGNTVNGLTRSAFLPADGKRISFPGLSEAGFAKLNDVSLYSHDYSSLNSLASGNERTTGSIDVKRSFQSNILKYLKIGAFYERSKNFSNSPTRIFYALGGSLADNGIQFTEGSLDSVGYPGTIKTFAWDDFRRFSSGVIDGTLPGVTVLPQVTDPLDLKDSLVETDYAGYVEGFLKFGKLEVVGGVRIERVDTAANVITSTAFVDQNGVADQAFEAASRRITQVSKSSTTLLPRLMLNYRFNDSLILRSGYYLSIARPNIFELGAPDSLSLVLLPFYGPSGNQPGLSISRGNPGLRAATTNNLDISLEWYFGNVGALKVGAFYKPTKNAFFSVSTPLINGIPDDVELPDDPRFQDLQTQYPNLYYATTQPMNDDKLARIWGVEISLERRLDFLPGMLSGLGVYANYTYTHGERTGRVPFSYVPEGEIEYKAPYGRSTPHSGTAALTYSKGSFEGSLSYSYQARYFSSWARHGRSNFQEPVDSLDFRGQYSFKLAGADVRIYAEASNLLKGPGDAGTSVSSGIAGTPKAINGASYFGGRTIRGGLSVSF